MEQRCPAATYRDVLELSTAPKETTQEQNDAFNRNHIIGRSQGLTDVLNTIARIAKTNASVLITGESGTGKELIAEAIHINSQRAKHPFVKVKTSEEFPKACLKVKCSGTRKELLPTLPPTVPDVSKWQTRERSSLMK